jgi:electron transfer flavoprotein alpha subunit
VIGVIVVRDGRPGAGAGDVAACTDELWLIGSGVGLVAAPPDARRVEFGAFAPGAWATWLANEIGDATVAFAASPDGRDLAGRVAERLGRELFAGCVEVRADRLIVPAYGGATTVLVRPNGAFVATVQVTSGHPFGGVERDDASSIALDAGGDCATLEILEPDVETVDLADAARIVAGGAGVASEDDFAVLADVGRGLGAAMGATRVITDRGWVPFRRQIGTTGTAVDPSLYVAFGISGAIQHTAGLGTPEHIISVNTDAACPMSQMADLAVVADATATIHALRELVGEGS